MIGKMVPGLERVMERKTNLSKTFTNFLIICRLFDSCKKKREE